MQREGALAPGFPCFAKPTTRSTAVVVFPTPPFGWSEQSLYYLTFVRPPFHEYKVFFETLATLSG